MDNDILKRQFKNAMNEIARLQAENEHLKEMLKLQQGKSITYEQPFRDLGDREIREKETDEALFRSLFRGREDVYAIRWQGREAFNYKPKD